MSGCGFNPKNESLGPKGSILLVRGGKHIGGV